MRRRILITGGAGFIGSHLADELLAHGYEVRVLDCLSPQVHGERRARPAYLDPAVELRVGDVRDRAAVDDALADVDAVVHLAAAVGVGQSMYRVEEYTSVNNVGTAVLLEAASRRPLKRLVVASSMSIYGEGSYRTVDGDPAEGRRSRAQLKSGRWEPLDDAGRPLVPLPTPEHREARPASVYALGKYDQERMCLIMGEAYGLPTTALRLFNVYGPRQALSNPYTGALAIFASRYLNRRPPLIFEDGGQMRDFVSVHDVARAFRLALERREAVGEVFNVGSGDPQTILEVAERMGEALGATVRPDVVLKYRVGDIRHCFADIAKARRLLGYEPRVAFRDGLPELLDALDGQTSEDRVLEARGELAARGLEV